MTTNKIIHIHAKCNYFEIHEQVKEENAVKRLQQIKEHYLWFKVHNHEVLPTKKIIKLRANVPLLRPQFDHNNKLSVKTIVVNPEFNFH